MPTGYTYCVQDGTVDDLRTFALRCARAFGACIEMRDEPADKLPPKDGFPARTYYQEKLESDRAELARLESMDYADKAAAAQEKFADDLTAWVDRQTVRRQHRERYEAMIAKVESWQPPTDNHAGLKSFMLQQLRESLDHDCSFWNDPAPEQTAPDQWHADALEAVRSDIAYHSKEHAKEVAAAERGSEWLRQLRASLE